MAASFTNRLYCLQKGNFTSTHLIAEGKDDRTEILFDSDLYIFRNPPLKKYATIPIFSTTSGSVSSYSLLNQEPTSTLRFDMEMLRLERASRLSNENQFTEIVNQINWDSRLADDFIYGIGLALSIGAHLTARKLAEKGESRYPNDPEIIKYAKILAPPKTLDKDIPPDPKIALNVKWLKEHREEFHGKWVALRDGSVIAIADRFEEIQKITGELKNSRIMVTRV